MIFFFTDAGFIAHYATLASRDVVRIHLDRAKTTLGVFPCLHTRIKGSNVLLFVRIVA